MAYGMLAPAGRAKNFTLRMLEELNDVSLEEPLRHSKE